MTDKAHNLKEIVAHALAWEGRLAAQKQVAMAG